MLVYLITKSLIHRFGDPFLILIFLRPLKNNKDWQNTLTILLRLVVKISLCDFVLFGFLLVFCSLKIDFFVYLLKRNFFFLKISLWKIYFKNSFRILRAKIKKKNDMQPYFDLFAHSFSFFLTKIQFWVEHESKLVVSNKWDNSQLWWVYQYSWEVGNA